ncbi:MAG: hypothetical protein KatS3mg052_2442 [Candidatus Roseilinea sp.]|nr:MAG: hypothetical protein KatS3mg052_2442 [Candidatus Roseilinea sp.]
MLLVKVEKKLKSNPDISLRHFVEELSFTLAPSEDGFTMANKRRIENLYYIAPVENLRSILERGILSHAEIENQGIEAFPIYDTEIVGSRQGRLTLHGRSLWEFANLYIFNPETRCSIASSTRGKAKTSLFWQSDPRSWALLSTSPLAMQPVRCLRSSPRRRACKSCFPEKEVRRLLGPRSEQIAVVQDPPMFSGPAGAGHTMSLILHRPGQPGPGTVRAAARGWIRLMASCPLCCFRCRKGRPHFCATPIEWGGGG